mmetsp:Transcript_1518/g.1810  ORF Transcript_1518/g.1810 Transcript_1518/m.1810 type:complete len:93 (-) Transcript_1518:879-1157(-)
MYQSYENDPKRLDHQQNIYHDNERYISSIQRINSKTFRHNDWTELEGILVLSYLLAHYFIHYCGKNPDFARQKAKVFDIAWDKYTLLVLPEQ